MNLFKGVQKAVERPFLAYQISRKRRDLAELPADTRIKAYLASALEDYLIDQTSYYSQVSEYTRIGGSLAKPPELPALLAWAIRYDADQSKAFYVTEAYLLTSENIALRDEVEELRSRYDQQEREVEASLLLQDEALGIIKSTLPNSRTN